VHYEFFSSDYTKQLRSLPVSARLQLKLMTVDALTSTDVSCNGEANQLQYLFLEITPYTYQWSTGSTTDTNTISDLAAGVYTVTVKML
jgi:heat shock protein HslJ